MTITQIKHAYKLFANPLASKSLVRYNVTQYLKALEYLGDKHVLKTFVQKRG